MTLALDVYRSTANRPEGGTDTFVTAGLVSDQPYAVDTLIMQDLPHSLPSLNVLVPPSQLGLTACPAGTASTTNPGSCSYTALHELRLPQRQQVLVHALRGPERLLGLRQDHELRARRHLHVRCRTAR